MTYMIRPCSSCKKSDKLVFIVNKGKRELIVVLRCDRCPEYTATSHCLPDSSLENAKHMTARAWNSAQDNRGGLDAMPRLQNIPTKWAEGAEE